MSGRESRADGQAFGDAVDGQGTDNGIALAKLDALVMRVFVATAKGDVLTVAAGVTVRD
jgi:hypothetical protein